MLEEEGVTIPYNVILTKVHINSIFRYLKVKISTDKLVLELSISPQSSRKYFILSQV